MGDEALDVADADDRFRWDRLTPSFQRAVTQTATLSITSLALADAGQYECTNNINSPYLTGSTTFTETFTVTGKYRFDAKFCSLKHAINSGKCDW